MKYSELVQRKKQYKYSANLCFDLINEEKIENFIPNITTTEILSEYLYGIIGEDITHSRILYGSYGTGKSHLMTVICAILGQINTSGTGFGKFLDSIGRYSSELVDYIKAFSNNEKPFLIVPVYSDFSDFDKCITFSLKKELDRQEIEVCFKNYYQEALALLDKWGNGEDSKKRLNEVCKIHGIKLNRLKKGLESFDIKSEKVFDAVFKDMTYGANFVSEGGNLTDNLDAANQAIKDKYQGIIFAFDEFGRFVEDQGESIKVKAIQDLAEYCDHSNNNNYLILVSHKQLSLYTERMRKGLSEEWKKVEGRFKSTSINIKYDQCLSLISHIIPKTNKWKNFKKKYEKELNALYEQAWDFKGFLLPPEGGNPFEGGFPLHPITLYALDRLSKKVAQNERTFFTYLASDEEYSLFSVLKAVDTKQFHFIGLDNIYDYFETNIKAYRLNEAYEIYKKLQFAINKLGVQNDSEIEIKVLKTIAVISIIADSAVLAPDKNTLCHVIDENEDNIEKAIHRLEALRIIKFMRQYGYYDFLDSSIYDFDSLIEERIDSVTDEMAITMLNEEFAQFVMYPYSYNAEYHMNRVFLPVFVSREDINKKSVYRQLPDYYDGALLFVVDSNYEEEQYTTQKGVPERALILINKNSIDLIEEVKRYIAIKYFYSKKNELKKDDPTVEKELAMYLEEQREIIDEQVERWKMMAGSSFETYLDGEKISICSEEEISDVISQIMRNTYDRTIVVNNDLINKNAISGAMRNARNKAINSIISCEDIFCNLPIMSPEHSIVRAILSKNQICADDTVGIINTFDDGTCTGAPVMREIRKYLRKCEKGQCSIQDLYAKLKEPPYGLRDGYIPVLLAYALRDYENVSLYFHGSERDYCAEELNNALNSPSDYSLYLCNWSEEQREYINGLETIFADKINTGTNNRLKNLYNAMNLHFTSITKLARTTEKYVSEITKLYRNILSVTYKDYHRFFFETLSTLDADLHSVVLQIQNIRGDLENVTNRQTLIVKSLMQEVLSLNNEASLKDYMLRQYDSKWSQKRQAHFDYYTNAMLEYLSNFDQQRTEEEFVKGIAEALSGFAIEYWNDSKSQDFKESFENAINQLENKEITNVVAEDELQIVIKDSEGEKISTKINTQDLDINGKMMMNKLLSVVDSFGQSLSYEEKLQIIAEVIAKL